MTPAMRGEQEQASAAARRLIGQLPGTAPLVPVTAVAAVLAVAVLSGWRTLRDGRRLAGRPVASSDAGLMEMVRTWRSREAQTPREFSVANPLLNTVLPRPAGRDHNDGTPRELTTAPAMAGCPAADMPAAAARAIRAATRPRA
jgi:hypothetical protein